MSKRAWPACVRCTHGGPEVASPMSIDMSVAYDLSAAPLVDLRCVVRIDIQRDRMVVRCGPAPARVCAGGCGRPAFNVTDVGRGRRRPVSVCVPPAFFFLALAAAILLPEEGWMEGS